MTAFREIERGSFSGGAHLTDGTLGQTFVDIADEIDAAADLTKVWHEPIVNAGRSVSSPGQGPSPYVFGSTLFLQFTPDTDDALRGFKIPSAYVGSPSVHVHWTKSGDGNENGRRARWRISYVVFAGNGAIPAVPTVIEVEQQYPSAETTDRTLVRSADLALDGFVAGYYVGLRVQAIAPTGGAALLSEPALFSIDLMYTRRINRP